MKGIDKIGNIKNILCTRGVIQLSYNEDISCCYHSLCYVIKLPCETLPGASEVVVMSTIPNFLSLRAFTTTDFLLQLLLS